MVQLLIPLDLFFDRLYLLLVQAEVWVNKFDHFDRKRFACVDIQGFVNFSGCAATQLLPNLPFNGLALNLFLLHFLREKVVLLLHLFHVGHERIDLQLPVHHVKLFVNLLNVRRNCDFCRRPCLSRHNLYSVCCVLEVLNLLVILLLRSGHSLVAIRTIHNLSKAQGKRVRDSIRLAPVIETIPVSTMA